MPLTDADSKDSKDSKRLDAKDPPATPVNTGVENSAVPSAAAAIDTKAAPRVVWLLLDIDGTLLTLDENNKQWNGDIEIWQQLCREQIAFAKTQNVILKIGVISARLFTDPILTAVVKGLSKFLYHEDENKKPTQLYDEKADEYKIKHLVDTYKIECKTHTTICQEKENELVPVFLTRHLLPKQNEILAAEIFYEFGDIAIETKFAEHTILEIKKSFCLDAIRQWENIAPEFVVMVDDQWEVRKELNSKGYHNVISAADCVANPGKVIAEIKRVTQLVIQDAAQNKPSVRAVVDQPVVVQAGSYPVDDDVGLINTNSACEQVSLSDSSGVAAVAAASQTATAAYPKTVTAAIPTLTYH